MGQAQQKRRAVLIVEDDAELRHLTAALFEDEQMDTIECESAEAALAILLIGGREVAMIFADVRLPGAISRADALVRRHRHQGQLANNLAAAARCIQARAAGGSSRRSAGVILP